MYTNELQGQSEFYQTYLPLVDKNLTLEEIINDYTDGVVRGNLIEFKLVINDINSVLFQTIKYLSSMRLKGKSIPKNILLVSLNTSTVYVFDSQDYLYFIENVYIGGASTNNFGFSGGNPLKTLDYKNSELDETELISLLRSNNYTKINIDENCIVGWGERFYRENPNASKSDFIGDSTGKVKILGEIRSPNKLKEFILPYEGTTNAKFHYLMDKLNDFLQKKDLGAFYTPKTYVEKSLELVREAINRVPEGNDYIILDRCAGTGNLEKIMTDEELSHCVLSTIEYYEYKVLLELLGDKVRHIIPPTEHENTFNMGLVRGADALAEAFINNPVIKQYLDNPKVTIILFENPPYAETTSLEHQKRKQGKKSSSWKDNFVVNEMRKEIKGQALNDLGNAFIWSAFKFYLRQPTDSYIVYSPIKYWKNQHLINKDFIKGFGFNRKHFHTNIKAFIGCILWANTEINNQETIYLESFDIDKDNQLVPAGLLPVHKIYNTYSEKYYDKTKDPTDTFDGIVTGLKGTETDDSKVKVRIKPRYNDNILGYLVADSATFDNPDAKSSLLVAGRYNGNGFFLRKNNYLEKLPMFCASRYITYFSSWTERTRIMKSADGSERYLKDYSQNKIEQIILKCLLFTVLETQNHMRSFTGSDGRFYKNELCLDNTNGDTIAINDLKKLKLNNKEKKLITQWELIMAEARKTANYNPKFNYGIYQIIQELNTYTVTDEKKKVFDYPQLNGHIKSLKQLVKAYYAEEIVPFLFEYEFLK
ncbi:hypothetical protein [Mammaliicoccus vitulinus]|uniref:hypothetical protein n=2 Tax=Staphylococcaceae TaxID=90964 RepID=UPI001ADFC88A|nr:hypothetical protein [Mammaliicoccus vitulinus]QTN11382.1 hypothetical protein G7A42_05765 [Mammaliicoccus vitulinus]